VFIKENDHHVETVEKKENKPNDWINDANRVEKLEMWAKCPT